MFSQQTLMIIFALVLAYAILAENKSEGYDNVGIQQGVHRFYLPRAYGHRSDPCDYERYDQYPYDYQPYEHPARFDKYEPYFHKYGYGNL